MIFDSIHYMKKKTSVFFLYMKKTCDLSEKSEWFVDQGRGQKKNNPKKTTSI